MAAPQILETHRSSNFSSVHRRRHKPNRKEIHLQAQWMTAEVKVKLVVNGILSVLAAFTLLRLLPYQFLQQEKLKEVRTQVQETERRVGKLRKDFSRSFDPHQVKQVMQENSPLIDPNQRQIYWK
ncbi:hypothetical protein [cyanobacterium endosymbiont of Rhopalodia gibberula]|uniref:slr1601 family putative cell division protein n=1 Tax=cyanobacterium endosymbiont of Rhopalodia gibberula TaxID=1763363 RepID=UPI000E648F68|nr:hypothetical protein [cyanobacterium endosymbiont of Rhopalodia gibberula]